MHSKYYKFFGIAWAIAFAVLSAIAFFIGSRGFSVKGEIIAVVVALLIGWIYAGSLKGAMKNIAKKTSAVSYMTEGSLRMGADFDRFLYSKTDKKEKAKKQS